MAGSAAGSTTMLGKVLMLCSVPNSLMEMLTQVLVTRFAFLPVVASPARSLWTLGVPME